MNPYKPIQATIEDIVTETPNIKTFVVRPEEKFAFQTGQFMELTVPGLGEAPFTPSSSPRVKEKLEFTIMDVGRVTSRLHTMNSGDGVGLRGPYGKGYPLSEFKGKEVLIVGGGVGLAPLRSLLFELLADVDKYKKIILKYGARTPQDLVYKQGLEEWGKERKLEIELSADKGDKSWKGKVGVVTVLLEKLKVDLENSVAVVCGPPIMMKFTTFKLLEIGYTPERIYLSMEKNMSCGIGKCGHCRLGKYYACKDGPVLTYDKIKDYPEVWD